MRITKQHRRRMFIAAVAAAMILLVASGLSRRDSNVFYHFLVQHPVAVPPVRMAFKLVGEEDRFVHDLFIARLECAPPSKDRRR